MKKILIVSALLLIGQSALAQSFIPVLEAPQRNQQVMADLMSAISMAPTKNEKGEIAKLQFSMAGLRGGKPSNKPLGQYLVEPNMEFRSAYKDEDPQTMCEFAFDLHQFLLMKGRDLLALQRNSDLKTYPYEKQSEFADMWWRTHSKKFKNMGGIWKDWFIHDALVDATNVWNYTFLRIEKQGSADRTIIGDSMVQAVVRKKP